MRMLTLLGLPLALAATACAAPERVPPLSPRAAELIDPRLPVRPEPAPQPPSPALAARLAELIAQARRRPWRRARGAGPEASACASAKP